MLYAYVNNEIVNVKDDVMNSSIVSRQRQVVSVHAILIL